MADIELDPTSVIERVLNVKNGDGSDLDLNAKSVTIEWHDPTYGTVASDTVSIDDAGLGRCLYTFSAAGMRLRPGVTYNVRLIVNDNGAITRVGQQGGASLTMRVTRPE